MVTCMRDNHTAYNFFVHGSTYPLIPSISVIDFAPQVKSNWEPLWIWGVRHVKLLAPYENPKELFSINIVFVHLLLVVFLLSFTVFSIML